MTRSGEPLRDRATDRAFAAVLVAVWLVLAVAVVAAFLLDRRIWAVDSVVLGSVFTGVYLVRERVRLTPVLFALLGVLVVAHGLAVFGLFRMSFLGSEYDTYIHTWSAIVLALVALNYLLHLELPLIDTVVLTLLIALGVGLVNELVEFAGYSLFGEGEGLFLLGPGDIGATDAFENLMTDFLHDFYGNVAGTVIGLWVWRGRWRGRPGRPDPQRTP